MPQNQPSPQSDAADSGDAASLETPQMTASTTDASASTPLPGEPGFKAPLTKKQLTRAQQTIKGMFISVGLTIAVVLPVIFLNPGSNAKTYRDRVDVAQIAQQTVETTGFQAIDPELQDPWWANHARWNSGAADGVGSWELGILDGDTHYAKVLQAKDANASWIAMNTEGAVPSGNAVEVDGVRWDERTVSAGGKTVVSLSTEIDGYTYVITPKDADDAFMRAVASKVSAAAPKN